MFSRFCWFYGWTDEHVLKMPARRFWMMERQIDRIRAENDIRSIRTGSTITPPQSKDHSRKIDEMIAQLTLEIGDKTRLRRNIVVAPEPGAKSKFLKLVRGG